MPEPGGIAHYNLAAETLTVADVAALAEGREPAGAAAWTSRSGWCTPRGWCSCQADVLTIAVIKERVPSALKGLTVTR